jgi:hypothetical protein
MPAERTLVVVVLTIAVLCSNQPVAAQTAAVGQLSYSEGSVSLQPRGNGDWIKVNPGNSVEVADNVWADQNSRAELLVGADIVRMESETSLTIESASEDRLELKLWLGSVIVANGGNANRMIRIETPNLMFALQEPGEYRLDVNGSDDETVATVWKGKGEATGGGARYFVPEGQRAKLSGTADLQIVLGPVLAADDFDQWAMNRDQSLDSSQSRRAAANDSTRATEADQSASTPDEADNAEPGPGGPGTVEIRCPTPWCEVVEAYPAPWIWPPWWGPYPDPWVLTASRSGTSPQTGAVVGTAHRRPVASATPQPGPVGSSLQSLPLSPQAVPAKAKPAQESGTSRPSNPIRNPGSTETKRDSQPARSQLRDLGSSPSERASMTKASETKTTRR